MAEDPDPMKITFIIEIEVGKNRVAAELRNGEGNMINRVAGDAVTVRAALGWITQTITEEVNAIFDGVEVIF